MARPLRIEFEGAFYHVMARGSRSFILHYQKTEGTGKQLCLTPTDNIAHLRCGGMAGYALVERMLDRLDTSTLSHEIARKDRPALSLETIERRNTDWNAA